MFQNRSWPPPEPVRSLPECITPHNHRAVNYCGDRVPKGYNIFRQKGSPRGITRVQENKTLFVSTKRGIDRHHTCAWFEK
jgi:hypothetical protein